MIMILDRIREEIRYFRQKDWSFADTGRFWDKTIDYDEINEKTYSYFKRFTDAFKSAEIPDQSYALDICSRTGKGTLFFWQQNKIRKAVCADVSEEMQKICQKLLSEAGVDFKTQLLKDYPLPFPENEFETVLCFESIEHFAKPDLLIKELSRVAQKGAKVVITTPNLFWEPMHSLAAVIGFHHSEGPHRFLSRRKLRRFVKDAGLEILKEETTILVPTGPKFLIKFGEWFEKIFKNSLMPYLGLRRILICIK